MDYTPEQISQLFDLLRIEYLRRGGTYNDLEPPRQEQPIDYITKVNNHFTSNQEIRDLYQYFFPNHNYLDFKRMIFDEFKYCVEHSNGKSRGIKGIQILPYKKD